MDKKVSPSLFVNDGSFMERYKHLQEKKEEKVTGATMSEHKPSKIITMASSPKATFSKTNIDSKAGEKRNSTSVASGGKLAFSLKHKSKLVAPPVNIGADDDGDESDGVNISGDGLVKRQKLEPLNACKPKPRQLDGVPPSPSDATVKNVADKLACFVAKHGRKFEQVTREKNPGDTPFKFLFDEGCSDYKYYEYQLSEEEKALSPSRESHASCSGGTGASSSKSASGQQRSVQPSANYQTPASALYGSAKDNISGNGESGPPTGTDPIAMMEFYMKKAAREERMRQPKQSKDEMPPPASLQAPAKRGHHMGDYIPPEELEKFLASCSDASGRKAYIEAAEKAKIQADNVGHKLLSKMGWREGEGLGSSKRGIADPIMAGDVKKDNLGVGAHQPGEVLPDDDIFEQYKKRMMLGYRHRPNPLNNPRKAYY